MKESSMGGGSEMGGIQHRGHLSIGSVWHGGGCLVWGHPAWRAFKHRECLTWEWGVQFGGIQHGGHLLVAQL